MTVDYIGYTLGEKMFGVGDFWLETTIIIKIESHPFYPINFETDFYGDEAKKREKKKIKMAD